MNIRRIISLAPSNTEIVFALGEGDKLVGVSECCDYPREAGLIDKIGGFARPDIKKIASLSPDLVLSTNFRFHLRVMPLLKAEGIPVYAIESRTVLDVPQAITLVGRLIGCQEKASQVAEDIKGKIEKICQKVKALIPKPRVCYICSHDPLCIALKSCTINKLIEVAGGINIIQDIDRDNVDDLLEAIIEKNPQVIIVSKGHRETADLLFYAKNQSRFKQTDAYFNNRIYQIDAKLVCRPGPRAAQGLETLAGFIHPAFIPG
ncbi:MAG: helical backbone metal receptor [Candidatus Omnitrophota bacterium]